jgi:hypothetical protein
MSLFGASQYPQKDPKNTPFSALPAIYTEEKRRKKISFEAEVLGVFYKKYFLCYKIIYNSINFIQKITKNVKKARF